MEVNTEKKFMCPKKDFFTWDYQKRNIDFMSDFDDDTASRFLTQIRAFSKEFEGEENTDIYLYINSRGGIVTSLLAMLDGMSLIPNDFVTICIGQCASCGAVLLSAGKKGKRYITEHSRVLIHQVSGGMWGKNSEIQADAKEIDRLNKMLIGILAKNCGKTVEELEQLTLGGDLVLDAKQAVEFGIVDAILTQDVINRLNGINNPEIIVSDDDGKDGEDGKCKPMEYKNNKDYLNSFMNLEIKSVKDDGGYFYIKGYASTPDLDRVADIVKPDCLIKSVKRMGVPAFIHQHDLSGIPLGVCEKVYMEGDKTAVELKMPKDDLGKTVKNRVDIGAYKGLSIGFVARDYDFTPEGYRVINDLDWYEVSLVTVPANPNAEIVEVKNRNKKQNNSSYDIINTIKNIRDVENLLCELGISKKEAGYIIKVIKSSQGEPVGDEGEGEPNPQSAEDNEKEVAEALNKILSTLQECKIK
jgi:ATP-dependent Clp protease protease subunit